MQKELIFGSDISDRVINVMRKNTARLPFSDALSLECKSFQESELFENGILVANPPYGIRIGEFEDAQKLYTEFGDFIKQKCQGTSAFIYAGDSAL